MGGEKCLNNDLQPPAWHSKLSLYTLLFRKNRTWFSVGVIVATVVIVRSATLITLFCFSTCRIMETSSILLVALLALYMMPTGELTQLNLLDENVC